MSFGSTYEFARWARHLAASQIRVRKLDSRAKASPALPLSNLIENVDVGHVQNTWANHDLVPLSQAAAQKISEWTYRRKYLLSSKPGWTRQAVDAWENEGGSRPNPASQRKIQTRSFRCSVIRFVFQTQLIIRSFTRRCGGAIARTPQV
jgi:hypothetical protein